MIKRPFVGMAAGFLAGVVLAAQNMGAHGAAAVLAGLFCAGWYARKRSACEKGRGGAWRIAARTAVFAVCFLFGALRYGQECRIRDAYLPYLQDGMRVAVQGKLDKKEIKNSQYIYELSSCVMADSQNELWKEAPVRCNRILVYTDSDFASVGEILVLNGKIKMWDRARNEGNFDAASFYRNRKIDFGLEEVELCRTCGRESRFKEGLYRLKGRVRDVCEAVLAPQEAGVLCAMALGDKSLPDAKLRESYRNCGLSHIMAISGLHAAVVGMACFRLLRKMGLGYWPAGAAAVFILFAYGQMAGMGNSVRRAVLMFGLLMFAGAVGRSYDVLNALGAAAFFLLAENPYLLWDAGFQFSFVSVAGIVCVGNCVDFSGQKYAKCKAALFSGTAAWLVTLPLVMWHYYEIPCYAVPVNLVVLPLLGIVLTSGLAGGLCGVGCAALFGESAGLRFAGALLFPCKLLLASVNLLCGAAEKLPGAVQITGKPGLWQVLFYYAGLALLAFWLRKRAGKRKGAAKTAESGMVRFGAAAALLLALLLWRGGGGTELDILDVGQGDGIFLRTGSGETAFVDGGSTGVGKVGTYRILPFLKYQGVRQVDYWFVTHTDEDHISGLRELLAAGYPIRNLVFSENAAEEADAAFEELAALAEENGSEICLVSACDILHLNAARIRVLSPLREAAYPDKNAASLVLRYEEDGFSGIFTGDVGSAEEKLLAETGALAPVTVYKAAHHGSKYSNSEAFLQALSPEISVISCAERNGYGHPGEEAVQNMERAGSRVFYTMRGGQIKIRYRNGRVAVEEYCGRTD